MTRKSLLEIEKEKGLQKDLRIKEIKQSLKVKYGFHSDALADKLIADDIAKIHERRENEIKTIKKKIMKNLAKMNPKF